MKSWPCASIVSLLLLSLLSGRAGTLAQFRTVFGDLDVELYDQQKPVTVQNFKRLVQSGAYQNTFFHRVQPGFVAQGGGYYTLIPGSAILFAPPWYYLGPVSSFGPITNEFSVGPRLSNTNGTIAMAKADGDPNSASCQWFFNLVDNSSILDSQNGGFTVFGHVVRDTGPAYWGGVLGLFNLLSYSNGVVNMRWWSAANDPVANQLQTLPVTYFYFDQPWYSDLFYVDISLLNVQVAVKANGNREISWNSVPGKTNCVDFTANFPPDWKLLVSTNGDGTAFKVTDSSPTGPRRFYRVRVVY